jgi:glycerol-3-phosphate O-acyltransferase
MLNSPQKEFTFEELIDLLLPYRRDIRERSLPVTVRVKAAAHDEMMRGVIDELTAHDLITRIDGDGGPHYTITDEQIPSAAYYRNTIVHFYVTIAITEVALACALDIEDDKLDRVIVTEALRLRDLLKFEFFFAPSDQFVEEVRHELSRHCPEWRNLARLGDVDSILQTFSPPVSPGALRPFIESYLLVADALVDLGDDAADPKHVAETALAAGTAAMEAGTLGSADSRSSVVLESALRLATSRHLIDAAPDVGRRRRTFRDEVTYMADRIRLIYASEAIDQSESSLDGKPIAGD